MARRQQTNRERNRTNHSYDRHVGGNELQPSILIVCEGKKTEPKYFTALARSLKLGSVHVVTRCGRGCCGALEIALSDGGVFD